MKKYVCLIISAVIFFSLCLVSFATIPAEYEYETVDGYARIIKYNGPGGNIKIPNTINNLPVKIIGEYAFCDNVKIKSIHIPANVTTLKTGIVNGCSELESITTSPSNQFFTAKDNVLFSKDKSILFYAAKKISGNYNVPASVKKIEQEAFRGCSDLTSVTTSCKKISDFTFAFCSSLSYVILKDGVESIGNHSFKDCKSLVSVVIPSSVSQLHEYTFYGCSSLKRIDVSSENKKYLSDNGVVYNKNKTELLFCPAGLYGDFIIPDSVEKIGYQSFMNCTEITHVTLPQTLKTISQGAFSNCTSLEKIEIPNSVTTIMAYAFERCSSLKKVILSKNITEIAFGTFTKCETLGYLEIPSGIMALKRSAFADCINLKNIVIPHCVNILEDFVFNNCPKLNISCGEDSAALNYAIKNNLDYTLVSSFKYISLKDDFTIGTAMEIIGFLSGSMQFNTLNDFMKADVNKDAKVTITDAMSIFKKLLKN